MKFLFPLFVAASVYAQSGSDLVAVKAAAEAGDPVSQDKLGLAFEQRFDGSNSMVWYRKAAENGVAHAQCQLGQGLLFQANMGFNLPKGERSARGHEALAWLEKSSNQGVRRAQISLGNALQKGDYAPQNLVEAYKWFSVAAVPNPKVANLGGLLAVEPKEAQSYRDSLILKMSQEQIAAGDLAVAAFRPNSGTTISIPQAKPAWLSKIKLKGIGGPANKRFAIINGTTVEAGESFPLKIDGNTVQVNCISVSSDSATVQIGGASGTVVLHLEQ